MMIFLGLKKSWTISPSASQRTLGLNLRRIFLTQAIFSELSAFPAGARAASEAISAWLAQVTKALERV